LSESELDTRAGVAAQGVSARLPEHRAMTMPETIRESAVATTAFVPLRTVAVIDDSDADLLYSQVVLTHAKLAQRVLTFGSAADALRHLRSAAPTIEVILLDINMPEMNGFEFLDAYERFDAGLRVRAVIVMLSSSPDPAERARARAYPSVHGYLVKPLRPEAFRSLLESIRLSS
jgi:CheY-like chemotaxis protein